MTTTTPGGSPQFPAVSGSIPPSTQDVMNAAVQTLQSHKNTWVSLPIRERITILDELIKDFAAIAQRWVDACLQAKGIAPDAPAVGEEWLAAAWTVLKNLCQLRQALTDIQAQGRPQIP